MDSGSVYIVFKAKCLSLDEKSSCLVGRAVVSACFAFDLFWEVGLVV